MEKLQAITGMITIIAIAVLLSPHKKRINKLFILKTWLLQIAMTMTIFHVPFIRKCFEMISLVFVKVYSFTTLGSRFLFGNLVDTSLSGWIFALQVLPSLIFFSALFSFLYHIRVLPFFINIFSKLMKKTLGLSGAESFAAVGNIFIGQSETPLIIKPLLSKLTHSELNSLITVGFSTISGAILGSISGMLGENNPVMQQQFATHFLIASVLSAPAALMISKIIVPETENIITTDVTLTSNEDNALNAISTGTFDGLKLALNVGAMLLVFISFIGMANYLLSDIIGEYSGLNQLLPHAKNGFTIQYIFGFVFAPFAWLIGITPDDVLLVGRLIGEKTVINEFYAFTEMKKLMQDQIFTNHKNIFLCSYALCGFSNFSSIGIMVGAMATLIPSRKTEVAKLSVKALIGASLACLMTACLAGIFMP
jgi:CNT family concentrative nucleoside transporter